MVTSRCPRKRPRCSWRSEIRQDAYGAGGRGRDATTYLLPEATQWCRSRKLYEENLSE